MEVFLSTICIVSHCIRVRVKPLYSLTSLIFQKCLNNLIILLKQGLRIMNCCGESDECTPLESVVSVDERGQLVLPKEIRERWGLKGGDKLAILTSMRGGEICCVAMVKADLLTKNCRLKFDWAHEEPSK